MKTATDKLYRLIKSMSPAEKRYFKRHYGSNTNTLTDLFDVINGQKSYDEEAVKEAFSDKVASNLKVYKFQLEQLLLQSLVSYRYFSNVGSKIRQGLEQVEILAERNLIDMAMKQLDKTKQICLKYEEFPYLVEICAKEFRLKYIRVDGHLVSSHPSFDEHRHYLNLLEYQNELTSLANQIADMVPQYPYPTPKEKDKAQKLLQHDLLAKPHPDSPIRSSFTIAQAKGNLNILLGDFAEALKHFEYSVDLFQKDKALKEHFAFYYLMALRRSIYCSVKAVDVACAKKRIEEANQFLTKKQQYQTHLIFIVKAELQLSILTGGKFLKQQQLERKISRLVRHFNLKNELVVAEIYLMLAYNLTILRNYASALDYLQILATTDKVTYSFAQETAALMELVNLYEQGDEVKLNKRLKVLRKKGNKNSYYEDSEVYQEFLDFFQTLQEPEADQAEKAAQLLDKWGEQQPDRVLRQIKEMHLDAWLKGKAESKPLVRILNAELD